MVGRSVAELVVIGGGLTGLWTALRARKRDPDRDVVLIEGDRIGNAASGRNGGFVAASITHGHANGTLAKRREFDERNLGLANLAGIEDTIARYGIDCHLRTPWRPVACHGGVSGSSICARAWPRPRPTASTSSSWTRSSRRAR